MSYRDTCIALVAEAERAYMAWRIAHSNADVLDVCIRHRDEAPRVDVQITAESFAALYPEALVHRVTPSTLFEGSFHVVLYVCHGAVTIEAQAILPAVYGDVPDLFRRRFEQHRPVAEVSP